MSDFVTDLLPHQWELVRKVILASPLTPKTKPNVSRDKLAQVITYFESRGNVPTSRQEAFFDQFEKIGKSPTSHEADRAINSILEGSEADEYRLLALKDQPKNLSTFSRKLQMIRIRAMANVE